MRGDNGGIRREGEGQRRGIEGLGRLVRMVFEALVCCVAFVGGIGVVEVWCAVSNILTWEWPSPSWKNGEEEFGVST